MLTITLPLAGIEIWLPGLIFIGFVIGFLSGMFGIGGGFLLTPTLKVIFGIPYPIAVGSDLTQICINSAISAWKHWRNQNVDLKLGFLLAAGALFGTEIGVRIIAFLKQGATILLNNRTFPLLDMVMNSLFLILLTSVCLYVLMETAGKPAKQETETHLSRRLRRVHIPPIVSFPTSYIQAYSLWIPTFSSIVVGVLTGLMGIGGGFVNFPLLIYAIGVPTHIAVGTSVLQVLFASGYGALRHAGQGHVELILVGIVLSGSIIGIQVGVRASQLLGGRSIRRYFALVIACGIGVILWDVFRSVWG